MERPKRKLTHLEKKIEDKVSRSPDNKAGKRAKRWKKFAAQYKATVGE